MDIVSRLKTFISYQDIPVTQFADNCNIPRPTLSQLLNGRNKKVSDELIGKIHETYPELSVLWLMFGEGDMLHKKNNEISEPQMGSIFDFNDNQSADIEQTTPSIDFNHNFNADNENSIAQKNTNRNTAISVDTTTNSNQIDKKPAEKPNVANGTITFNSDNSKKIVNIIVYYNDNSFESFVPNPNK